MTSFGKLGMNHHEFTDADFLDWLENRVANTPNTQKLKVKRKHMQRMARIISPSATWGHGGAMKLEFINKKIVDARASVASRVAARLAPEQANAGT